MGPNSQNHFDFIVIGVGSMGSAACRFLAKRGHRVLGLERFTIPHEFGAHSGQTRLIRKAYFEHPDYIPLLIRSYELWKELEAETGERVYEETGIFYAGPKDSEVIYGTRTSAALYGIDVRELDSSYAREFPHFAIPSDFEILFEPEAGFLRPAKAIRSFATLAERDGAVIRQNAKVEGWEVSDGTVEVRADGEVFTASKIVVTAGPWSAQLLPGIGATLDVTRQFVGWFDGETRENFTLGRFPCWAIADEEAEGLYYGFPWLDAQTSSEVSGMKLAHHFAGQTTDPDGVDRNVNHVDVENLTARLGRFIPSAPREFLAGKVCLYSNTPDGHFVIDNLPGLENYACIAWGFSGHGFKFVPAVGEILADLAENGATPHPIAFLGASRFAL